MRPSIYGVQHYMTYMAEKGCKGGGKNDQDADKDGNKSCCNRSMDDASKIPSEVYVILILLNCDHRTIYGEAIRRRFSLLKYKSKWA